MRDVERALIKRKVDPAVIADIMSAPYVRDDDDKQDNANHCAAIMRRCDEVLPPETVELVMFERACCKYGFRLDNSRALAREHGGEPLEEKLKLLGGQKYMGKPYLTEDGLIATGGCAGTWNGKEFDCSCWRFAGKRPADGPMPLSYCLCCAGHFRHHYQKALGLRLRVERVESSVFRDRSKPCSFLLRIVK